MIEFSNGGFLVEDFCELPSIPKQIKKLYLDVETSSNDPKIRAVNPWKVNNCRVIGAGITWDDNPKVYFVQRKHLLPWLYDVMAVADAWVNHNIKFDAHTIFNDLGLEFVGDYICTLAKARVFDSDRMFNRGGYSEEELSKTLLDEDISWYKNSLKPSLPTKGKSANKDFGKIPIDILARYGCQDVITVRKLNNYLDKELPAEAAWVLQNEINLTRMLIAAERRGVLTSTPQLKLEILRGTEILYKLQEKLARDLEYEFNPASPDDCYEVLINRLGYPKIYNGKSTTNAPSFDKHTLKEYKKLNRPYTETVIDIETYREQSQRISLFWEPWIEQSVDEILHSSYVQNVRSGRMACKAPNAQQLNKAAKKQILARPGYTFLCYDYSQLEYRWMVHYLKNKAGIKAYNEDPTTDYHQWVADLCGIKRSPAKTLNFMIGFGGGKKKVTSALSVDPDIIARIGTDEAKIKQEAISIYTAYHNNLPELKDRQRLAETTAKDQGYVKTCYGRRLHLEPDFAFKGFNRVVQATAADNAKEAAVLTSSVFNQTLRELDTHLVEIVHDEFLYEVPDDPEAIVKADAEIIRCLESPSARCRVPIKAERGNPASTWAAAKG